MSLTLQLLGSPRVVRGGQDGYRIRSRKTWAVLAYLALAERPPTRSRLASLLFAEAEDPQRALRWCLAEIRRALGADGSVEGDPVVLRLSEDVAVDVDVVTKGGWRDAVVLPALGADLLEGMAVRGAAAFGTWLLSQQRRLSAASEAILHEAALGSLSDGQVRTAIGYAVRATAMSPLDENHHALLIRLYRAAGDEDAANRQFDTFAATLRAELGVEPGPAVTAALREPLVGPEEIVNDVTVSAIVEAGAAAISAGAVDAGVHSLRTAVGLADRTGATRLRITSRLVLAEALIHSLRGHDEEGLSALFEVDAIGSAHGIGDAVAQARAELGYVDFLRGRYERAEVRLADAVRLAEPSSPVAAKAMTYLGAVESDRSNYQRASSLLEQAGALSRAAGQTRMQAYGLSILGRLNLFCGELDTAAEQLDAAIRLATAEHWLAFLPWPQALRGEVQLARADAPGAADLLQQAFARACQIGDPCWEGMAARGLALVSAATGDTERAFVALADARRRANRLADPYLWLDAHILDALCDLGVRHHHPDTRVWVEALQTVAHRTGMKGFALRALRHGAALGITGNAAAATMLAADLDAELARPAPSPVPSGSRTTGLGGRHEGTEKG